MVLCVFGGSREKEREGREREGEDRLADSIAKVPRHFFYGPLPGVRQFRESTIRVPDREEKLIPPFQPT